MNPLHHVSAKSSHYNSSAQYYDVFNEKNSEVMNQLIGKILKKHKVKTVLDLTCGTGSQIFWLSDHGHDVTGSDINLKMLQVAKRKAREKNLNIPLIKGDMRTSKLGQLDSVITIFNSVGHLTKADFGKAIRNIYSNLKVGGLYIFDIFNFEHLIYKNNITNLTIDWQETIGKTKTRDIQYSTIDKNGILASYTISHTQYEFKKPKVSKVAQTLQVYSAKQLNEMLNKIGFKVLNQYDMNGSKFHKTQSERIITVAKKC